MTGVQVSQEHSPASPAMRRLHERKAADEQYRDRSLRYEYDDDGCFVIKGRFPGCTHTHFIDGHHIRHWADGGETSLDNLVLLCRRHHRLVHEGGFACERSATGQLLFRDERGEVIGISATIPVIGDHPKAAERIRKRLETLHIDAMTCVPDLSGGISIDYPLAVELLWYRNFPIVHETL